MIIEIRTNDYNARRYTKPWIAKVSYDQLGKSNYEFGHWLGAPGEEGILSIDVQAEDIIAHGQKDHRGNGTRCYFYIVKDNKELLEISRTDAFNHFKEQQIKPKQDNNPLVAFTVEQLLAEVERRK